jgi:hypothetical protein
MTANIRAPHPRPPRPPRDQREKSLEVTNGAIGDAFSDKLLSTCEAETLVDRFMGTRDEWAFRFGLNNAVGLGYLLYSGPYVPEDSQMEDGARELLEPLVIPWKESSMDAAEELGRVSGRAVIAELLSGIAVPPKSSTELKAIREFEGQLAPTLSALGLTATVWGALKRGDEDVGMSASLYDRFGESIADLEVLKTNAGLEAILLDTSNGTYEAGRIELGRRVLGDLNGNGLAEALKDILKL